MSFNKQTQRCGTCENEVKQALTGFRQAFLSFTYDGVLTPQEWTTLLAGAAGDRLNVQEALAFIRGDALHFIEGLISFAFADRSINDDEDRHIREMLSILMIPPEMAQSSINRLDYLKYISNILRGILPSVQPSPGTHLESDEICHLETPATYHKVNAKSVVPVPGRLVATNKKLFFLSPSGGAEIPWKNLIKVEHQGRSVYLELSTKKGNGRYDVLDPMLVSAIIETLVKISKRQLLAPTGEMSSRHIPHEVKVAVWQRDQGRCVQCGSSDYLEFDHIIPHSKGGANTINNIQLLCRRCNLAKGGSI
ncbi:MAG TPA: HNH endonuclease signature motif containing protein [Chloroflexia bacterium]|jgi:hypothetical protein